MSLTKVTGILILSAAMVLSASAQVPEATPVTPLSPTEIPTLVRGGTMGELFGVYIPRDETMIQTSLNFARSFYLGVAHDLSETRRLRLDADGRLRILNQEIQTTKAKRDAAKKAKDEGERAELGDALRQQERERDYLEDVEKMLQANESRLASDQSAAEAHVKGLELELDVARRHAEISKVNPGSAGMSAYRDMLRTMLDVQRSAANLWTDAGELRKDLAEEQLRQLQSVEKSNRGQ